jgi:membrane protease YdiL (CAAX protease family)
MILIGVFVAILVFVRDPEALASGHAIEELDGLTMGLTSAVQILGLAGLAAGLSVFLGDRSHDGHLVWWSIPRGHEVGARLHRHLGLQRPRWTWAVVALLGGLTVWTFPSMLAAWLMETLQIDSVSLEATSRLLLEGPTPHRLAMGFAVIVTAPIFEEVIFRGYLWDVAERATGRWGAFVLTTLLFAAYHLDPVHTVSLLPTAAFLGALRLASGSLWPSILAHFANNGIAIVITLLTADVAAEEELPLWLSLSGTLFTIIVFALGVAWARKRPSSPTPHGALS